MNISLLKIRKKEKFKVEGHCWKIEMLGYTFYYYKKFYTLLYDSSIVINDDSRRKFFITVRKYILMLRIKSMDNVALKHRLGVKMYENKKLSGMVNGGIVSFKELPLKLVIDYVYGKKCIAFKNDAIWFVEVDNKIYKVEAVYNEFSKIKHSDK